MRILFLICCILAVTVSVAAQAKTVTNADLMTYRQERIKAENALLEDYAKLGFSSPKEMERRKAAEAKERAELSTKLRAEELERERLQAQQQAYAQNAAAYYQYSYVEREPRYNTLPYFLSYGRRYHYPVIQSPFQQEGYFAGGQFWPTSGRTPSQPLIRIMRR